MAKECRHIWIKLIPWAKDGAKICLKCGALKTGDGSITLTSNMDMGGGSVSNVNLVDGVDVSSHALRHAGGGADEIASPLDYGAIPLRTSQHVGRAGYYLLPLVAQYNFGTLNDAGANMIHASGYPVLRKMRFDRIAIYIAGAGAAGAAGRLGIYNDSGCYPSSLVLDAGTFDATTTGFKEIVINQTLNPGTYWVVVLLNDSTVDIRIYAYYLGFVGMGPGLYGVVNYLSVAQSYGALPATFPGGGSFATGPPMLAIALRLAELL